MTPTYHPPDWEQQESDEEVILELAARGIPVCVVIVTVILWYLWKLWT